MGIDISDKIWENSKWKEVGEQEYKNFIFNYKGKLTYRPCAGTCFYHNFGYYDLSFLDENSHIKYWDWCRVAREIEDCGKIKYKILENHEEILKMLKEYLENNPCKQEDNLNKGIEENEINWEEVEKQRKQRLFSLREMLIRRSKNNDTNNGQN
jgi:hypothetical protein